MSPRLDPVSRPRVFWIRARRNTSSRPWQTRFLSIGRDVHYREQIRADRSHEKRRSRWQITARFGDHHVRTRVRRPRGLIERTCRPTRGRTGERRVHHRTHQPWRIRRTDSFDHWSKKAAEGVTLPRNDRTTDQTVFDQWTPTWYPPCCTRELLI